tara:strand:- start:268 stop:657 length:390 start_codon:yes stop_codon:yes gene_type:complete
MKKIINKKKSNKSFGILFFIVFLIIGFWPLTNGEEIRFWSILISLLFLILGFLNSKILTPLSYAWIKLGLFLGKFITPIVMAIIFYLIISPFGVVIRLFGKDLLMKKYSKKSSYWIKREKKMNPMKMQF